MKRQAFSLVAVLMVLAGCNEAQQRVGCGDDAALQTLEQTYAEARAAQRALLSGGENYAAAKIGPVPGSGLDAALAQAELRVNRSKAALDEGRMACPVI